MNTDQAIYINVIKSSDKFLKEEFYSYIITFLRECLAKQFIQFKIYPFITKQ